jgi:hypothetical protein
VYCEPPTGGSPALTKATWVQFGLLSLPSLTTGQLSMKVSGTVLKKPVTVSGVVMVTVQVVGPAVPGQAVQLKLVPAGTVAVKVTDVLYK